ncbi:MAG TPA: tetratricopeptide repeat protein [Anaeromyxobacteraceae bacterium]|jgi:tetratricopeptide (TPR) repeat protein|nr:tetratricopeptide repeat protein [Anaeromyxobacteraceae bacterium]
MATSEERRRQRIAEVAGLERAGDVKGALDAATGALEEDEGAGELHYMRGCYLLQLARHGEALRALERAVELEPAHAQAINNLGIARFVLGSHGEAAEAFREAARLDPTLARARLNLGNALFELGALREAAAAYEEAIRVAPRYLKAYVYAADAFLGLGDFDAALRQADLLAALDPRGGAELRARIEGGRG